MTSPGPRWPDPVVRPRRTYDPRANFSSNELIHPAVGDLVAGLVADFRPGTLTRYPVQDRALDSAAKLFGREEDEILLAPGSDSVIRLLVSAARELYGGRLVLQDPNYEAWTTAAALAGGWRVTRVRKPSDPARRWLNEMRVAAEASVSSIVAVSWPNGPDGHLPAWAELTALAASCRARGHLLVIDGCYAGFSGDYRRLAQLAGPNCLVLFSWSKSFGLAGGRLATALADGAIIRFLRAFGQESHVNTLMLQALCATPGRHRAFEQVWADIAGTRETTREWLAGRAVHAPPSGGNFLHVPCESEFTAKKLTTELSTRGFRVRDMGDTPGLQHHVRFTVGHGPEHMRFLHSLDPLLAFLDR
ncbi:MULTISPECIES: aminotransferase class I/II-fold pyridoxal phosphate-dependent enzyme [unclassified Amycolatopsis]|uniref:aminotransferase class I/II-fold pyridoxal phosphate-dependent enzyme n=1 Tax=unclassified Amycolatopsis TaxID=2618356 RepID=UPI00287480F7|nr:MULTISPECIES: aminotransferase class I/II-fold pyridoxal phosphate-dependent enzyme [unclassified Amycolatopsis]MDS0139295.1 aminotransferase class I/II-fold pyridoxal phosphate-dependent enzyme [Amycolatopsis sp. 505]MDS0144527.1 aminotransferase class I/II-fold pyridoxal phosphate-dependent enzyme [Amycolatopsis sp. CM201R]